MSVHHHSEESLSAKTQKVLVVVLLTLLTFVAEISFGYITKSQSLKADAWHMLSHAFALTINLIGYALAQRVLRRSQQQDSVQRINTITGMVSAVLLLIVSVGILMESAWRFIEPVPVNFKDALIVSFLGLLVNFISALLLKGHHHHDGHDHDHDHNLKSAYLHVVADALTSILAIVALVIGLFYSVPYFDSAVGILGGIVIGIWSVQLLRDSLKKLFS